MSVKQEDEKKSDSSKISQAAGFSILLPGESGEKYQMGFRSTVEELGAKTPLQVYLAEKIFQSLWWTRRYEKQKRSSIISAMADVLSGHVTPQKDRLIILKLLQASFWEAPELKKRMESSGHNPESLLERAIYNQQDQIQKFDRLIDLRVKTLLKLQQSYEALVNRSVLQERMKLQNDLLKRDLQAIDPPVLENTDDKRQAKSRK